MRQLEKVIDTMYDLSDFQSGQVVNTLSAEASVAKTAERFRVLRTTQYLR